jgi:hypothetical protein
MMLIFLHKDSYDNTPLTKRAPAKKSVHYAQVSSVKAAGSRPASGLCTKVDGQTKSWIS